MEFVRLYHNGIRQALLWAGVDDTVMHLHCGLAIYLGAQVVLRDRRASLDALLLVVVLELANETVDRLDSGAWNWPDTKHDIVNTLFWPMVIFAVQRYRRSRWERSAPRRRTRTVASTGGRGLPLPQRSVP